MFINCVKYEECAVHMKMHSEKGREALYIGCVYMPTDSSSISVVDSCYNSSLNASKYKKSIQ